MSFFKGTSINQDGRFINKDKKLIEKIEFPPEYATQINKNKLNLEIIKSWVDKKLTDIVDILYSNPVGCFSRKNGKRYTSSEAMEMLDKKLEVLGCAFDKQYKLLKGVLDSDRKKLSKVPEYKVASDEELINLMVSKCVKSMIFDNF